MYLPSCKISFNGFQPSDQIRKSIESTMQALQSISPSDSILKLCVESVENNVKGSLCIKSFSGKFESQQSGFEVLKVVCRLNKSLQDQIKLWASQRKFCEN